MLPYTRKKPQRIEDYRVDIADCPGWVLGTTRIPRPGEAVYCAGGHGTVTGSAGRTGDGSQLVEIRLRGVTKQTFFAAASNVLLPPLNRAQSRSDDRSAWDDVRAGANGLLDKNPRLA